jgi:hypothetical protein
MVIESLRAEQLVDALQTAALIVTAGAQIYTMLLLRNEMRSAARALKSVLDGNAEVMKSLDWVWKRIHEIEVRMGVHQGSPPDDAPSV